jgi:hypothetical protein
MSALIVRKLGFFMRKIGYVDEAGFCFFLFPPAKAGGLVREFHFTKYPDINAPQNSQTPSFISNLHLPPALAGGLGR